jgi:hypothetical protein
VAELEATTVRKGNKKVSVTLSGWVVKSINWWDDGSIDHLVVGDKDYDLGTRFAITGSATIAPGWSAGFNITVNTQGDIFGYQGGFGPSDQFDDLGGTFASITTLYSYIYIKSDSYGALNWGHLSPASDNAAVLADLSGTVIESNAVQFEGSAFFLRPTGTGGGIAGRGGLAGLAGVTWGDFMTCSGLGAAGIGADCWGAAQPAIRYDSPTWGGFRFETSYGKNQLTGPTIVDDFAGFPNDLTGSNFNFDTSDTDFADIAVFYTGDWNSIKLSAAASYTWIETGVSTVTGGPNGGGVSPFCEFDGFDNRCATGGEVDLFQVGASVMHKPSGLGIYGYYQNESTDGRVFFLDDDGDVFRFNIPDTDVWYVKPFWRKAWSPIGATVLYGEYAEYHDQFANLVGFDLRGQGVLPTCDDGSVATDCFVTGSEVQAWGLGIVQEIDSAAMHLWLRWRHQELDVDFVGQRPDDSLVRLNRGFDDWDLFQAGGIIFF